MGMCHVRLKKFVLILLNFIEIQQSIYARPSRIKKYIPSEADPKKDVCYPPWLLQQNTPRRQENYFYPLGVEYREEHKNRWYTLFGLWRYEHDFSNPLHPKYKYAFWPFLFKKQGWGPHEDYAAVFPLAGRLRHFLGKDLIEWALWPLWVKTKTRERIQYWFPWPLLNRRCGSDGKGFAFYPLGGHFYKKGYYEERYCLWPLVYKCEKMQPELSIRKGFLPFFAYEKTPNIKDLSIIWPIWGRRWETNPKYEEHRLLWPFWVHGDGENRLVRRWGPFHTYSVDKKRHKVKEWFMWPFVKQLDWPQKRLKIHQEQFCYFLLWHQTQTSPEGQFKAFKTHFWPFYSYWDNGQGHKQIQMLSLLDVFFPNNKPLRALYNAFAIYRFEELPGVRRQSLFWRLIQEESTSNSEHFLIKGLIDYKKSPSVQHFSLLHGLLGYHKEKGNKYQTVSFFWKRFEQKARPWACKDNRREPKHWEIMDIKRL